MTSRIRRSSWSLPAAVTFVALVVWWIVQERGFYRVDDYQYFHEAQTFGRFSKTWLTSVYYQHFAPLHRLVFSLGDHATVRSWRAILLLELGMLGVMLAAYIGILRMLFGRQRGLMLVVAIVASSLYFAIPLAWPSAGLQGLPDVAAGTVTLYCFLRAIRDRQPLWAVLAALSLAAGLLFYIRPLLTVGVVVLVRVLFLEEDLRPRALARSLRRDWWAFLPIAIVIGVYLFYILDHHVLTSAPKRTVPIDQIPQLTKNFLAGNLIPAIGGVLPGPFRPRGLLGSAAVLALHVLVVATFALSLVRKRSAWRAWFFIAAVMGASLLLVIQGRLAELGPNIGFDLRYFTHLPWLISLGVLFALSPRKTVDLEPKPEPVAPWPRMRLLAGLALIVVVSNIASAARVVNAWGGKDARTWADATFSSFKDLPRPQILPEGDVPGAVTTFESGRLRSYIYPVMGLTPDAISSQLIPTATVDGGGVVTPAHFVARATDDRTRCLKKPADVLLDQPISGTVVFVANGSPGVPGVRTPVSIDTGQGFGEPGRALDPAGNGQSAFSAELPDVRGARVLPPPGAKVCVTSFQLGEMVPGR